MMIKTVRIAEIHKLVHHMENAHDIYIYIGRFTYSKLSFISPHIALLYESIICTHRPFENPKVIISFLSNSRTSEFSPNEYLGREHTYPFQLNRTSPARLLLLPFCFRSRLIFRFLRLFPFLLQSSHPSLRFQSLICHLHAIFGRFCRLVFFISM